RAEQAPPEAGLPQALLQPRAAAREAGLVEDADVVAMKPARFQGFDRCLRMLGGVEGRDDCFVCHVVHHSAALRPGADRRAYGRSRPSRRLPASTAAPPGAAPPPLPGGAG